MANVWKSQVFLADFGMRCVFLLVVMLFFSTNLCCYMAVCQNLVPLVNIKIAGKWMFIPLKMVLIGIDPYPYVVMLIFLRQ